MELSAAYGHSDPSPPRRLAALAAMQHGVVATRQLEEIGYSMTTIRRRVADRWLRRVHVGVYTTSHTPLSFRANCMAAVLACGPDAVVSHHAAAALHDLRPMPQAQIDVTAAGKRKHRGVRCHVSVIPDVDRAAIDRIPVTALPRTLLDYAEQSGERQLSAALEAAQRRDLIDLLTLRPLLARSNGRRGLTRLRRALAELADDPPWLLSELEGAFRELLRGTGIPEPRFNVPVEGHLVDCVWPAQRLAVEVDSWGFHRTRARFEEDRRRDADLQLAGWRVLRVTHRRLTADAARVIADIRRLLAVAP